MADQKLTPAQIARIALAYGLQRDPNDSQKLIVPTHLKQAVLRDRDLLLSGQEIGKVNTPVDNTPEERSWGDAAISTGLRVTPAVAGGLLGSLGGPAGTAIGGAAGGSLGESLAELYEGTGLNPTQIALSAALNAIPTAKWLAKGGTAVLRTIAPGVERRLAGMLAPKAASVGAGLLDRINPRELAKTVAKSATTGAVAAPIENSASRYVQGQPTTLQDVARDMTLGALLGGTTPLAVKAAQVPFRAVARTVDSGLPAWLRKSEKISTAALQEERAGQRQKGQPQTRETNQTAAALGITGNISDQQDQVLRQVTQANTKIRDAVSQPNINNIDLSNSPDLVRRLNKMAEHFDNQDLGQKDADTARRLSQAIDGRVQISPEDALDLKQFLDKNRSSGSYTIDPQNATAAKGLKDLSDSIRADLKSQLPGVAKALDFAHEGYDLLGDLYKKGAINANVSLESDLGMKLARFVLRPSVRAKTANLINKLAGNVYESVPDVESLPQRPPTRGLLNSTKLGITEKSSAKDPSGVVPGYKPFVSRVQPRLTAGDPDTIPQSPLRTGGANQPGGFGGLESPGGVMTPEQVPFTGSAPIGGRLSRGEPRVRTIPPVLDPDVIVTSAPNRVSPPANVLEGEVLQGNASVVTPVRARLTAGDPDTIPQSPPRTGGANQPGGFGGIESPGGQMTPEQVPFTGSAPVGGRPSRGEPRVRTMSPVRDPDVIVTPVPKRGVSPANVLEGEILPDRGLKAGEEVYLAAPPVRANNVETSVAKRERSARKLRTAKPTVEDVQPATATVSKTAQATDTPAEAAKEIQSEVSRVIDVQGVTKAMEVKRRVLATLMKEMQPAKTAVAEWDTTGINAKGKRVNVPPPYAETIAITIPGDGTFRIPRTPEAITNLMKRITAASSTAWEGVGSIKTTRPVARPGRATW